MVSSVPSGGGTCSAGATDELVLGVGAVVAGGRVEDAPGSADVEGCSVPGVGGTAVVDSTEIGFVPCPQAATATARTASVARFTPGGLRGAAGRSPRRRCRV